MTSLLTFADYSEQLRTKSIDTPSTAPNVPIAGAASGAAVPPPAPPPKPEGWKEDQIAILQAKEQVRYSLEAFLPVAKCVDGMASMR